MKKWTVHAKVRGMQRANFLLWRFQAEVQKMRVEMASMKRDVEHYSRQEHMELRKRYRELTDLLVGCRMHVQITRIDEAKNDLVLSEKEAWELIQQLNTLLSSQDTYLTG
ncbi:hypothetical protein ACFX2I_047259 [Malus domestica]